MAESIETSSTNGASPPPQNGETESSASERLKTLAAKATALYGMKDYTAAADIYSEATELQAEINGEMNVENADLLYAYGRCLFYVAQKTSTVLGGTAAQAQLAQKKEKKVSKKIKANGTQSQSAQTDPNSTLLAITETVSAADVVPDSDLKPNQEGSSGDKPLFQISGDGNWTDSEDDEQEANGEEDEDEEEDDFANSFELLDLARILYLHKLESMQESTAEEVDKGKYIASIDLTPPIREIKSRIADIYDLQAEIGLEGEKFSNAVTDLKSCLALKEELEQPESSLLAECHYKLSLALEVAAQDQQRDADGNPVGDIIIDWNIRNEAVIQQEKAIDCCKLRVSKETKALTTMQPGKEKDAAMGQIEDVQEMISELEDRLTELRKPPVNVKAETESDLNKDMMAGVLGQIMGAVNTSKEEQKEQLAKVIAGATDLSGMVKKKKPKAEVPSRPNGSSNGNGTKRKVEFMDDADEDVKEKKAKVEDVQDSGS